MSDTNKMTSSPPLKKKIAKWLPVVSAFSVAMVSFGVALSLSRPWDFPFILFAVLFGSMGIQITKWNIKKPL